MRGLESAHPVTDRPGERPRNVAKQLGLDQTLRKRGDVHRDIGSVRERRLCSCNAEATSSLPVPDSPRMSTRLSDGAARFSRASASTIAGDCPRSALAACPQVAPADLPCRCAVAAL